MKKIMVAALVGMGIVIFCALAQANTFAWLFSQDPKSQKLGDQNIIVAYQDCSQITDCQERCGCQADNCYDRCGDNKSCESECYDAFYDCCENCK